jgi:hypothetical protein
MLVYIVPALDVKKGDFFIFHDGYGRQIRADKVTKTVWNSTSRSLRRIETRRLTHYHDKRDLVLVGRE